MLQKEIGEPISLSSESRNSHTKKFSEALVLKNIENSQVNSFAVTLNN